MYQNAYLHNLMNERDRRIIDSSRNNTAPSTPSESTSSHHNFQPFHYHGPNHSHSHSNRSGNRCKLQFHVCNSMIPRNIMLTTAPYNAVSRDSVITEKESKTADESSADRFVYDSDSNSNTTQYVSKPQRKRPRSTRQQRPPGLPIPRPRAQSPTCGEKEPEFDETVVSDMDNVEKGTGSQSGSANFDLRMRQCTNHFIVKSMETSYQDHCTSTGFKRTQWIVFFLLLVHLFFSVAFGLLEEKRKNGLDILPRTMDRFGEWFQWGYVPLALPFSLIPSSRNIFKRRWKRWVSLIICLLVVGLQAWLCYQIYLSTSYFSSAIHELLICTKDSLENETTRGLDGFFSKNSGNVVEADRSTSEMEGEKNTRLLEDEDAASIYSKNDDSGDSSSAIDDILSRNEMLYASFAAVATTLLSILGTAVAVTMKTDFLHVVSICIFTGISLVSVLYAYEVRQELAMLIIFVLPGSLLCYSSYNGDRDKRYTFLTRVEIERENEALRMSLDRVEEACLKNNPANRSEVHVVNEVLVTSKKVMSIESYHIRFNDLNLISLIGSGGMGEVLLATFHGSKVVCKRIIRELISVESVIKFREEIELMSTLRHPNIIQFIGASWDNCSNLCIVMEYMENGDLHHVLRSKIGRSFTWEDNLLKLSTDAAQGMHYLHSQDPPIIHRDLKSVNILCSATFGCKVTDFGLSKRSQRLTSDQCEYNEESKTGSNYVNRFRTVVGTPHWLAPEIIRNESYGVSADVYSFGIVLCELATGELPYKGREEKGVRLLMEIAGGLRPELPSDLLPSLRTLIEDCVNDLDSRRPTFEEILDRLQGPIREEIENEAEKEVYDRRVILEMVRMRKQQFVLELEEAIERSKIEVKM